MFSLVTDGSRWVALAVVGGLAALSSCSDAPNAGPSGGAGTGGSATPGNSGASGAGGSSVAGSSGGGAAGSSSQGTSGAGAGGAGAGGTAGASSGTSGTSAAGTSGAGGGAAAAVVSDDFEATEVGAPPNPALFSVRGSGTVQISTEVPRAGGGQKVVKVVSGGSGATLFLNESVFPLPSGVVHFRVWMRFANADWANHIAFIESSPGMESQEVRFGGQNNAYHANLAADGDGLSPDPFAFPSCATCVKPVADEWKCLRGMFDFTNSRARLYVGESLAVDAEKDSVKNDWHSGSGTLPMAPTELGFGWALYGGSQNTVYYDDLAIGYAELPCN